MKFSKTILVAEIGINHNGDMALAEDMIRSAALSGANAVKFQNYRTEDFISNKRLRYAYKSQGRDVEEPQFDMFKRCELTFADIVRLKKICDSVGVDFFSTPTGEEGIFDLIKVGAKYIKNGSDYLGHIPLIQEMARSGVPTILSTGMATEEEVSDAVSAYRQAGGSELILLACTSAYPTPIESLHLRRISTLSQNYSCPSGFSDHSSGWEAAVAAVSLGACMIEKHFTTDRSLPGPDQWFSSTPDEFAELVRRVRDVEKMLGSGDLSPTLAEAESRKNFRLSCTSARDLRAGIPLQQSDIVFRRPANGLPPKSLHLILGKCLKEAVTEGSPLNLTDFYL